MQLQLMCPHCKNDDSSLLLKLYEYGDRDTYICDVCAKTFEVHNAQNSEQQGKNRSQNPHEKVSDRKHG